MSHHSHSSKYTFISKWVLTGQEFKRYLINYLPSIKTTIMKMKK
jgi:hypothetical protein